MDLRELRSSFEDKEYLYYDVAKQEFFIWDKCMSAVARRRDHCILITRGGVEEDINKAILSTDYGTHLVFAYSRKALDDLNHAGLSDEEILNKYATLKDFSGELIEKILCTKEYDALLEDVKQEKGVFKLL